MNSNEVFTLYGIEMINRVSFNKNDKSFLGGGLMEIYFDVAFPNYSSINEDILPTLYHIRDGNNPPIENEIGGAMGISAYIDENSLEVHFVDLNSLIVEVVQKVPLTHFIIIAEAWRDFLLTPPLNGSPVSGSQSDLIV